jgi:hypothetical protein
LSKLLIAGFVGFIMLTGADRRELRFPEEAAQKDINEEASARHLPDFKN